MKTITVLLLCLVLLLLSACSTPAQAPLDSTLENSPIQASVQQTPAVDVQTTLESAPEQIPQISNSFLAMRETTWRGGTLRAELHGTEEQYRGLLATELLITGPDGFEQTIPLDGEEPAQLYDDDYLFAIEDMNLDGEPDIRVAMGIFAGGNTPFHVFVWDAFRGTFVGDDALSALVSPKFMSYERLVIESIANGAAGHIDSVYANVDGELRQFFRREYLYNEKVDEEQIVQSILCGDEWVEVSREPVPVWPSMSQDTDALAKAIPPPSGDIVATRYGVVGGKPVRVDACIPLGDDLAKTIVVSGENGISQIMEQDWTAPLDSENEAFLSLKDFNLDGEPDIQLSSNDPAKDEYYIFWLWDAAVGQFVKNNTLGRIPGVQLCSDGFLLSYGSEGAAVHNASLYAWVDGKPQCIYRLVLDGFKYSGNRGNDCVYVMSLFNGTELELWAQGMDIAATPVSDYRPEEVIVLDITTAKPVAEVAASDRYNGPLNPMEYPQSLDSGAFTHVVDVYYEPVAIQRGDDTDALVHADSTGVYEHAPMTFKKLYETEPGTRIVGIAEGSKYRVYWLETDGSVWTLKTMSISGLEAAETVMSHTTPADVADMRLAKTNLNCFAVPAYDYDNDFALHLYNIWETGDDDFGIGKPGDVIIMEGTSPLETRYRFVEGRYARIVKTDRGGAVEIVPTEIPMREGDERNETRLLLLTGAMPKTVSLVYDGVYFQVGSNLYKYSFGTGETLLLTDDVEWFSGGLFAANGASTVYEYRDANPDVGWDACIIPLLHIDGAEFTAATIVHHETTDFVAMGVKNGEPLAVAVQLSYLSGE